MQKNDEFFEKVEKLEKELWFLIKFTLPKLKEDILSQAGGSTKEIEKIQESISALQSGLDSLSSQAEQFNKDISGFRESISSLQTTVENNSASIQNAQTDIFGIRGDISNLSASVESNQTDISSLQTKVDGCEKDITALNAGLDAAKLDITNSASQIDANAKAIEKNAEDISSLSTAAKETSAQVTQIGDDLTSAKQAIEGAQADISGLKTSVTKNAADISSNSTLIESSSKDISSLTSRVESLEKKPSGGRTMEVVYDMTSEDADINQGFTEGVGGGKSIYWKNDYDYLRFYSSLSNLSGILEVPVNNKRHSDVALQAIAANGKTLHFFKLMLNNPTKRISTSLGLTLTINSDGTTTVKAALNPDYYIYRVEGIIGV